MDTFIRLAAVAVGVFAGLSVLIGVTASMLSSRCNRLMEGYQPQGPSLDVTNPPHGGSGVPRRKA